MCFSLFWTICVPAYFKFLQQDFPQSHLQICKLLQICLVFSYVQICRRRMVCASSFYVENCLVVSNTWFFHGCLRQRFLTAETCMYSETHTCHTRYTYQEEDTRHMQHLLSRLGASSKHVHSTMGSLLHADAIPGVRLLTECMDLPSLSGDRKCLRLRRHRPIKYPIKYLTPMYTGCALVQKAPEWLRLEWLALIGVHHTALNHIVHEQAYAKDMHTIVWIIYSFANDMR